MELQKVTSQWRNKAVTKLLYASARGEVPWKIVAMPFLGETIDSIRSQVEKIQAMLSDVWTVEVSATDADYDGRTALHVAAGSGSVTVMKLLVDKGANVNALDRHGNTPLHDAFSQGQRAAAQLLTSLGGRLAYSRKRMATELCTAVRESDINTVR